MTEIINKLNEGGPFFTYPMVIFFIVIIVLFGVAFLKDEKSERTISLLKSISWFVAAWAILGHTIGLITAFDNIGAHGELAPEYIAEGLKIALLNMVFGSVVFLVARLAIIILLLKGKKQ